MSFLKEIESPVSTSILAVSTYPGSFGKYNVALALVPPDPVPYAITLRKLGFYCSGVYPYPGFGRTNFLSTQVTGGLNKVVAKQINPTKALKALKKFEYVAASS